MHDVVAHGLSVVVTLTQGASLAVRRDPERAAVAMEQVAGAGRQATTDTRRLLDVLRTDDEAVLAPQPVLTGLPGLADEVRRTGLAVHLHQTGPCDALEPSVQTTVYRIVQESMTNVLKHASGATAVDVRLQYSPDVVRSDIADDGAPPLATAEGNGLTGMRKRIAPFRSGLTAGPCRDGWRVRGELLGDTVTWQARHFGIPFRMTSAITAYDAPRSFVDEQTRGPFHHWRHEHVFTTTAPGQTLMIDTVDFRSPLGPLGAVADRLVLDRYMPHLPRRRNMWLKATLERPT